MLIVIHYYSMIIDYRNFTFYPFHGIVSLEILVSFPLEGIVSELDTGSLSARSRSDSADDAHDKNNNKGDHRRRNNDELSSSSASRATAAAADEWGDEELGKAEVPVLLVFAIHLLYIAFGGVIFALLEQWSYMDAFYYCFVSLTTIGKRQCWG